MKYDRTGYIKQISLWFVKIISLRPIIYIFIAEGTLNIDYPKSVSKKIIFSPWNLDNK